MTSVATLVLAGLLFASAIPARAQAPTDVMARQASDMVITSLHFLGVPYRRAGESESGFDCSGFTRYVFETSLGMALPRRADEQAKARGLSAVKRPHIEPGDLLFFNTRRRTYSHVGIYVGEGRFIHAPRPGAAVRLEDMRVAYWAKRYTGARRAPPSPAPPSPAAPAIGEPSVTASAADSVEP